MLEKYERIKEVRFNLAAKAVFVSKDICVMDNGEEIIIRQDDSSYLMNEDQKPLLKAALESVPDYQAIVDTIVKE